MAGHHCALLGVFEASRCRLFVVGLGWGASPLFVESAAAAGHGGFAYVAERGVARRESPGKIRVFSKKNVGKRMMFEFWCGFDWRFFGFDCVDRCLLWWWLIVLSLNRHDWDLLDKKKLVFTIFCLVYRIFHSSSGPPCREGEKERRREREREREWLKDYGA